MPKHMYTQRDTHVHKSHMHVIYTHACISKYPSPQSSMYRRDAQYLHTNVQKTGGRVHPSTHPSIHPPHQICFPVLAAYAKSIKDDADYILKEVTSLLLDERFGYGAVGRACGPVFACLLACLVCAAPGVRGWVLAATAAADHPQPQHIESINLFLCLFVLLIHPFFPSSLPTSTPNTNSSPRSPFIHPFFPPQSPPPPHPPTPCSGYPRLAEALKRDVASIQFKKREDAEAFIDRLLESELNWIFVSEKVRPSVVRWWWWRRRRLLFGWAGLGWLCACANDRWVPDLLKTH